MYKIGDTETYYMLLPPALQDTDAACFGYALGRQIKKFKSYAKKLNLWGDLDGMDSRYYDILAACMNAPYYRSDYTDEVKLQLIKSAYATHRIAGSREAVETLLGMVFEKAYFRRWDEYGGDPYHFKVEIYDVLTEDAATVLANVLQRVKAARSVTEIQLGREAYQAESISAATDGYARAPCIFEDNSGENEAKMESCTGATFEALTYMPDIFENNSGKNEATVTIRAGATAEAIVYMPDIL